MRTTSLPLVGLKTSPNLSLRILIITFMLLGSGQAFSQVDTAIADQHLSETLDSIVRTDKDVQPQLYRMNYWISGGLALASTAANIWAIPNVIKAKPELTDAELASLNPDKHRGFDQWALKLDPTKRDQNYDYSHKMLPVIIAATGSLALDKKIRRDWLRLLVMYWETHAVTFNMYNFSFFGPAFQNKVRPVSYYTHFDDEFRRRGNHRNSFYSGHTASAAAASFFMAKVYTDYHPELGNKKYIFFGLATIPPLVEGYLRMKALAHFPSDVIVGLIIGATCGIVVPELHRYKRQGVKLGVTATPVGPGISLTWQPKDRKLY